MKKKNALIILLIAIYVLSPIDIIPDAIFGAGQIDDLIVLFSGIAKLISMYQEKQRVIDA